MLLFGQLITAQMLFIHLTFILFPVSLVIQREVSTEVRVKSC